MIRKVEVERFSLTSARPFDEVLAAINDAVGHPEMTEFWESTHRAQTVAELESTIQKVLGRAGLMSFVQFDHGAIVRKETGRDTPRMVRLVIGNPLIMKEMAKTILNLADPYGKAPLAKLFIKGQMIWQGDHAIAAGAQKVNFIADEDYEVTPLLQGFADAMNQFAGKGFTNWEVNRPQSIFKKVFAPFGLVEGQIFAEHDLIYLHHDLLFWGARNVDGRGFDKEENRPTNLQIPLVRKQS